MMKIILLFLFTATSIFAPKDLISQNQIVDDLVFQDLDQSLLKIWIGAKSENNTGMSDMFDASLKEWNSVKQKLGTFDLPHINTKEMVDDVNYYFNLLGTSIALIDYNNIEKLSYHILYEFRSLRQCYFSSTYSLDQLWDVIDVYSEIDFTIDDPMMDLKEWSEFEDLVNKMICYWENYDVMHINEIIQYFPGMNKREHSKAKEQVTTCTHTLLIAIETAFQDKFKLPCDQLGDAFVELLQLYAYSKPSGLM